MNFSKKYLSILLIVEHYNLISFEKDLTDHRPLGVEILGISVHEFPQNIRFAVSNNDKFAHSNLVSK